MSDLVILILLYGAGTLLLLAEIFIPSQAILTVSGLGFIIVAIIKTFDYGGREAGVTAIISCAIILPIAAFYSIKYYRLTPVGKKMAPPNPTLTSADTALPTDKLTSLVGLTGTVVSPLRPVGICDFDGKRIPCIVEHGMVDTGATVQGTAVKSGNLAVRPLNT